MNILNSIIRNRVEEDSDAIQDDELDWVKIAQEKGFENKDKAGETDNNLPSSWRQNQEGELAVDVWHDAVSYYLRAAIAGIEAEDLEIIVGNDSVSIAGERLQSALEDGQQFLAQECHWGRFARTVILPSEINPAGVSAILKNGILLITAPKLKQEGTFRVSVAGSKDREEVFGKVEEL